MEPIPHNHREGLITPIILVNNISDLIKSGILVREAGSLDFWNEISGWFHANKEAGHPVYRMSGSEVEVPSDIDIRNWDGNLNGLINPIVAGAYVVGIDYNLYCIFGWSNNKGGSTICFDFI